MANILITGGAGFIGSHTADALLRAGHHVRILDLLDPQVHGPDARFPAYLDPRVECVRGDARRLDDLAAALQDIDAVYHLAAQTGVGQSMYEIKSYVDGNTTSTAAVIEALIRRNKPLRRLVIAASRAVYGEGAHHCPDCGNVHPGPRRREDMERGCFDATCPRCGKVVQPIPTTEDLTQHPISIYGWTKKSQEELGVLAASAYGLPVVCLRYFNVYGSRQSLQNPYTGVVSIFYSRILGGKPISMYEAGRPRRDFVHVSDVARANLLALDADVPPGSCVNIGSGVGCTIRELAEGLARAVGRPADLQDRGEFRVGDVWACYADLARARKLLGFEPRTSLDQGLAEFANWAATQQAEDRYETTVAELRKHNLFGQGPKAGT